MINQFLLLIFVFCSPRAFGFGQFFTVTPFPTPQAKLKTCEGSLSTFHDVEQLFSNNHNKSTYGQVRIENDTFTDVPLRQLIPQKLIEGTVNSRTKMQQNGRDLKLKAINDKMPPSRTSYLGFNVKNTSEGAIHEKLNTESNEFSGIRLFDGSPKVLRAGTIFDSASQTQKNLSFEQDLKNRGYELPERIVDREFGTSIPIFEIGLLNIEKGVYDAGFPLLLSVLANKYFDPHYNFNQYTLHSKTDIISQSQAMVYLIAAKAQRKIYESKLDFEVVLDPNTGNEITTSEGLFLMRMSVDKLIEKYSDITFNLRKANEPTAIDTVGRDLRDQNTEYFSSLKEGAPAIRTENDMKIALFKLGRLNELLFNLPLIELMKIPIFKSRMSAPGMNASSIELNKYLIFFEAYYQLAWGAYKLLPRERAEETNVSMQYYESFLIDVNAKQNYLNLIERMQETRMLKDRTFDTNKYGELWIMNTNEVLAFAQRNKKALLEQEWDTNFLKEWPVHN